MPRMRKGTAALGSSVFFALAPGMVAGVVPWLLTGWGSGGTGPFGGAVRSVVVLCGGVLLAGGAGVLVHAFVRFVVEGLGTPAPVAPPVHLVVGGLYRYVRNPMYIAVVAAVVGQAAVLWRGVLVVYALGLCVLFGAFVKGYEEPALRRRFGVEYDVYCARVRAWVPTAPRP
ncbi:methyltransferase family protein [Yinghuangia seranimata]|uniref:methyltransferase family protein n=1 Tax=Yinghuangia seranimata TaxID=408067 RepID=UPI00248C36DB|nr:methyltransferase [Yinghuangia seranimata]MDI2127969.1 methyltransferase [Yinghuangia seranimata]